MPRIRGSRRRASLMPEVGLTPLIDTALTLLIVFMVTTPMLEHAIRVDLPKGALKEGGKEPQELIVSIDKKGALFFNNRPVTLATLGKEVQEAASRLRKPAEKSVWLFVHGDTTTVTTLSAVIEQVKGIGGVKDVKIATDAKVAGHIA